MIRKCLGGCGTQTTIQPFKDNRVVSYECTKCRNKRIELRAKIYTSVVRAETIIHEHLIEYQG